MIKTTREVLGRELWTYGEDVLAERTPTLTDAQMTAIGEVSARILYASPPGFYIAKALAMGAIEVLEGVPREPARQRRRNGSVR